MTAGKFAAGAGLEVGFEGRGFFAIPESNCGLDIPGAEFGGVWDAAFVVLLQAGVGVGGEAGLVAAVIMHGLDLHVFTINGMFMRT